MPMGKGTYGNKPGRPKKKMRKQGDMKKNKIATGAKGPRGKNMKKSYGR